MPTTLPIYLFSGALDTVGDDTEGVRMVAAQYRRAGVTDVLLLHPPGKLLAFRISGAAALLPSVRYCHAVDD